MWQQPELFDWDAPDCFLPISKKRTRKLIEYDKLYELFLKGPVKFRDIEELTGVSHNAVAQVITTLSLRYPIYEVKRGVYKLYGNDDYGDGINHEVKLWDDE